MNKSSARRSVGFDLALDRLIGQWPDGTRSTTLSTSSGTAHVLENGGRGVPILLVPGGGATGASWCRVAQQLPDRPVFAMDIIGDAGRSVPTDGRLSGPDALYSWMDSVLADLGVAELDLAGHSYGGWLALTYALARPGRIRRLSLVSPSMCFNGMSSRYILHALSLLVRPSPPAARRLIGWETAGVLPEPSSLDVYVAATTRKWPGIVRPSRPRPNDVRDLRVAETHLILAAADRSQNNSRCEATARQNMPDLRVTVADKTSHHNILDRGAATIATVLASD